MKTLAIDTSHTTGTVAALNSPSVATRRLGASGEHARRITSALNEAAGELGWRLSHTELIVVVLGPGSFTGLRVGVAAAKGIAWASGARLVGACGFETVARETARLTGNPVSPIHIAFEAGRGDVYAAKATPTTVPVGWHIGPANLLSADAWLASLPPDSTVSGPAVAGLVDRLNAAGHHVAPPEAWFPSAVAAAEVGLARASAGDFDEPATLVPHYLRPSYADERATGA